MTSSAEFIQVMAGIAGAGIVSPGQSLDEPYDAERSNAAFERDQLPRVDPDRFQPGVEVEEIVGVAAVLPTTARQNARDGFSAHDGFKVRGELKVRTD